MSSDMFPDGAVQYLLDHAEPSADICGVCEKKIETMTFKGTGVCSVICRKAKGDDVSSVGTHMFVTTGEKRMIDSARKGEGTLGVVSVAKAPKKKKASSPNDKRVTEQEVFVCRCGHPGLGCYCRGKR